MENVFKRCSKIIINIFSKIDSIDFTVVKKEINEGCSDNLNHNKFT